MKILLISKYARDLEDGQPTRHYFFSRQFASEGHKVMLVKSRANLSQSAAPISGLFERKTDGNYDQITLNGALIKRGFGIKRLWSWVLFEWRLRRIFNEIAKFNPDVIIVSSLSILTFLNGLALKRKLRRPLMLEVRDIYPLTLTEVGKYSPRNPFVIFLAWVERTGYRNADRLLSTLEHADSHFEAIAERKLPFSWLPTGYEEGLYKEPKREGDRALEKLSALKERGAFIVGYAGTIGKANALESVFAAATGLSESNPKVHFVFFGDGPLKAQYEAEYGCLKNITFLGYFSKATLPYYLSHCHVLVNTWSKTPLYRFGISPNKWNEYMYSGRPLILAHDYPSRIFDEARFGWQIPAGDNGALGHKVSEVSAMNPDELDRMGANGKKHLLANLSYRKLATDYLEAIRSCVQNAGNGSTHTR